MKIVNNEIQLGGFTATELAELYKTPLYVYEEEQIKKNIEKIRNAIAYEPKRIHYALFCNNNLEILKFLRKEKIQITATSPGDVFIANKAGFRKNEIIVSGTNFNKEDFLFMKNSGVSINVDSLNQLEEYCKINPNSKVGLRFNLEIKLPKKMGIVGIGRESRLGLEEYQLEDALKIASKYAVKINGLQTYLGTNVMLVLPFIEALKNLIELGKKIDSLEYIDIGGGFGIDYSENPKEFEWDVFGKETDKLMYDFSKLKKMEITLILEPGRSIIADAGTLLTKIVSIKNTSKLFIGTDTCFAHFMRYFLYNAEHRIVKTDEIYFKHGSNADICGNTTLSVDFLGKNKKLPKPKNGDLLAIFNVGAYGYAMSNHFLSRPRPAEILVSKGKSRIIRTREKLSDLL